MFVILNECEETCSPPVGAKSNLAKSHGEKGLLGETKVNGAKARSSETFLHNIYIITIKK